MKAIIGVMGAGTVDEEERQEAFELGQLIATNEWITLTGGRDQGVMDAASKGAKSKDGLVLGIIPDMDMIHASDAVDIGVVTGLGSGRNVINVLTPQIVIACRGKSLGTISEIALALKHGKPVILLNCVENCVNLFSQICPECVFAVKTPEDAVKKAAGLLSS